MRTKTLTAAENGDAVIFDRDVLGFSPETHNHVITVAEAVGAFTVDVLVNGEWASPGADCIDVDARDGDGKANAVLLRRDGCFTAIRVTCENAGVVTCGSQEVFR